MKGKAGFVAVAVGAGTTVFLPITPPVLGITSTHVDVAKPVHVAAHAPKGSYLYELPALAPTDQDPGSTVSIESKATIAQITGGTATQSGRVRVQARRSAAETGVLRIVAARSAGQSGGVRIVANVTSEAA